MKQALTKLALAAASALAVTGAANAAVSVTVNSGAGYDYAADLLAVPDSAIIYDFDTIFAPGYSYTPATATGVGSVPNVIRQPKGDDTVFGVVDPTSSPAIFTAASGLSTFSFLVGSPDAFNKVVFKRADNSILGTLQGAALFPGITLGGLDTAHRITYAFGGERAYSIEFYSNVNAASYAFEFDRFAGTVPEPTTWAMMIIGFFGFGSVLRRSRKQAALTAA